MKNFILGFLILILIGECIYLAIPKKKTEKVLAEKTILSTPTPTVPPTSSPTPAPTASPTPKPMATKSPTQIPRPKYTPAEVNGFVNRFAAQYGVDPNVLRHIAICESGFNPGAYNAGYAGLFQFGANTWKNLRLQIGENVDPELRFDAEEAAQTAAYALSLGKSGIWPNCHP